VTRRGRLLVLGVVAAVAAVAGAFAYAQIPSSTGVITACYSKSGGQLRVIDADSASCGKSETKLTWNQQGVAGSPGLPGTNGTNGTDGVSGWQVVTESGAATVSAGTEAEGEDVSCPAGKVPLGIGGTVEFVKNNAFEIQGQVAQTQIDQLNDGSYRATAFLSRLDGAPMTTGESLEYEIWVTCATVGS
jgi:hypothetical protein